SLPADDSAGELHGQLHTHPLPASGYPSKSNQSCRVECYRNIRPPTAHFRQQSPVHLPSPKVPSQSPYSEDYLLQEAAAAHPEKTPEQPVPIHASCSRQIHTAIP